eukprot:TRINITY_DN5026_c0_g1_i2.p1 TRINITY_DN5026_c0_g1~~TRINITY_DN5026_c0_g1_i2.p1  ORF type:complete len:352 (-),score=53.97 TRINITY_DN5026_c0_g1_i2:27-1082(-)
MMERPILFSLFIAFLCISFTYGQTKPNILFILADDMGYGEPGKFPSTSPHGRISTPTLDAFAEQGMRFTDAYTGEAVCAPSRCALMTGYHTGHGRIRGNYPGDYPLSKTDVTIASLLKKKAGYNTALIGKWGLGQNDTTGAPRLQGFDYYFGQLTQVEAHNYYPLYVWENERRNDLSLNNNASRTRCMDDPSSCTWTQDLFTSKAIDWLNQQTAKQPWFLYLAFTVPHAGGWKDTEESGAPVPTDLDYANKSWPIVEKDHAASITLQDKDISLILDVLKKKGFEDNTIVFFASDNGAHNEGGHSYLFFNSSGPLRGFKRSLYEGGIRTPSMVRWPGKIKPGSVSNLSLIHI